MREASLKVNGAEFTLAVVSGLGNARRVLEKIKSGEVKYDLVEVMACPGGCIGGAGQPISLDPAVKQKRTRGIYENDRMLELHKSQENPYVKELYSNVLGDVGSHKAHELLHTSYKNRKRISDDGMALSDVNGEASLEVNVCFGTGCFLKGSQKLLHDVLEHIRENDLNDLVNVSASFCFERCDRGPTIKVGDEVIERCTPQMVKEIIDREAGLFKKEVAENV